MFLYHYFEPNWDLKAYLWKCGTDDQVFEISAPTKLLWSLLVSLSNKKLFGIVLYSHLYFQKDSTVFSVGPYDGNLLLLTLPLQVFCGAVDRGESSLYESRSEACLLDQCL